jgi:hypothetical protein
VLGWVGLGFGLSLLDGAADVFLERNSTLVRCFPGVRVLGVHWVSLGLFVLGSSVSVRMWEDLG